MMHRLATAYLPNLMPGLTSGLVSSLMIAFMMSGAHAQTIPLDVVATVGMIGDVAREVGGECVTVSVLVGPGGDPHLYRASASDVTTLGRAELVLYGGLQLEGRMEDVLARLGNRVPTLAVMEALDRDELLADADDDNRYDPHLWMDASLWRQTVPVIAEAIREARPDCAEIDQNVARYHQELTALHGWATATLATIPPETRVLITAHDAFYYFAQAYDFRASEGVQGISTDAEASVADIREVVDEVIATGVPAIFLESTVNPRNIRAVQAAARDRGVSVEVGGELYSDAMGDDNSADGTYIGMIRHNVLTITTALGGETTPWPDALAAWAERWNVDANR